MQANSGDPDQTPHFVCTMCLCPTKRMLGIYGFKCNYFAYLIRVAETWGVYCRNNFLSESTLGTADLSKFINMKKNFK